MPFRSIALFFSALVALTGAQADHKIGVILPLTGDFGYFGEEVRQGMTIALDDAKAAGEDVPEFMFEDDHCLAVDAVTSYKALREHKGAELIIGPACSACIQAVAPVAKNSKHPVLFLLDTGDAVSTLSDPLYSIGFDPPKMARGLAADMRARGINRVAVLEEEEEYAHLIASSFIEAWQKDGGIISGTSSQLLTERDFRPVLTKLLAGKPEALFFSGAYEGGSFLRQLRTLNKTIPIYGNDTMCVSSTIETAKEASDFARCANVVIDDELPQAKKFREQIVKKYGKAPVSLFYPALGYDAVVNSLSLISGKKSSLVTLSGAGERDGRGVYDIVPQILEIRGGVMKAVAR